ncbi:MAG: ABC transporter permease [Candidatus Helarchaeota archaeon]|nr:ABC transporter permease [Candidatus Helarchaeota archaeon]
MKNIYKIAIRNILRYKRRSLMTFLLIIVGVVMVIVFSGVSLSFKNMMVGQITDSMLGHLQIHKKGYLSSIDNLPLHLNINEPEMNNIEKLFDDQKDEIEAYSLRIKLGAMLSNFQQTTNIRLTAVYPEMENKTCPNLISRIKDFSKERDKFVQPGELILPENLANGMNLKVGNEVVLIATNKDGSVNGIGLKISGIIESLIGPTGRDGYIHIDDAKNLLRITENEVNEVTIRLKNINKLNRAEKSFGKEIGKFVNKKGMPTFELHTWPDLSPFSTIAAIIDILIITVKIVLISIVLISILNVMMMAVYERVSEIGTMSAIGTLPSKILWLFVTEGFFLGFISTVVGIIIGVLSLFFINLAEIHFSFGRMKNLLLETSIDPGELLTIFIIVMMVAIISSFQPALKASRMNPVDSLRHI